MKSKTDIAHYIAQSIKSSDKIHIQIAEEADFPNPNVILMIKSARTLMPMARIPAMVMAKALGTDPKVLLDGCLAVYHPDLHAVNADIAPCALVKRSTTASCSFHSPCLGPGRANPQ